VENPQPPRVLQTAGGRNIQRRTLYESLGEPVSENLHGAAGEYYCKTDYTAELCSQMKFLLTQNPTEFKRIVFDDSKKPARLLADWWEKHQKADEARTKKEREKLG